jgi:hypothetical protein
MKLAKSLLFVACTLLGANITYCQTDVNLDDLVESDAKPTKVFANNAFKSSRVINSHSMEMIGKGVLDVRILHRFGTVENGIRDLFGLDAASMRMGFDYGIGRNLSIGFGRSTFKKELDGFVKYRLLHQHTGLKASPISVIYVGGITCVTAPYSGPPAGNTFGNKFGYYHTIILGRKFSSALSAQLAPTFVHTNLVDLNTSANDQVAIGIGARYKVTKRVALMLDTHPIVYGQNTNRTPLSLGVDIETGGHVFQMHLSNATGMNERAFVTETFGDWSKIQFRFGFNLSRVFTVVPNTSESW